MAIFNSGEITVAGTANVDLGQAQSPPPPSGARYGAVYFIDMHAVGASTWTFKLQYHLPGGPVFEGTYIDLTTVSAGLTTTGATALVLAAPFGPNAGTPTLSTPVPFPTRIVVTRTAGVGAATFVLTGFVGD